MFFKFMSLMEGQDVLSILNSFFCVCAVLVSGKQFLKLRKPYKMKRIFCLGETESIYMGLFKNRTQNAKKMGQNRA